MNTEELLKPRYKVIADYPKSLYEVGTILNAGWRSEDCIYCDTEGPRWRHYPHLFKPIEWWEERKPEDMPEYVKGNVGSFFRVMKVAHPNQNFRLFHIEDEIEHRFAYKGQYEPATKEDYETYLTNNKLNP